MAIQTNAADMHLHGSKAMGLRTSSPISISAWINADWSSGTRRSFVGIYGPATDSLVDTPVTAAQLGTSGAGDLECWTWGGNSLVKTAMSSMTAYSGLWVFITYTYDGSTHRLYLNGALLATGTAIPTPGYLNQIYINGYPAGGISEVAAFQLSQYSLYVRTLSPDEILSIYAASGRRHGITNGILGAFQFDELSQGTAVSLVTDVSGSGIPLTSLGIGPAMSYTFVNTLANSNIRPV
jgi:hypothetical protein